MTHFSVSVNPRASETDMLGHINNTTVAVWFEELRVRYLESLRHPGDKLPRLHLLVVKVLLEYLDETLYGTEVVMMMRSVSVGNSSITMEGDMYQGGRHVVRAEAVLVNRDPETGRPARVGDEHRERIAMS